MAERSSPKIVAWMKPVCGWSNGVRAVFAKYGLDYEDKDIVNNPFNYAEMVQRTGQYLQPCVEIDGHLLADVSGDEVEAWLIERGYAQPVTVGGSVRGCEG
jgi:monothiol glutaredoxin